MEQVVHAAWCARDDCDGGGGPLSKSAQSLEYECVVPCAPAYGSRRRVFGVGGTARHSNRKCPS